MREFYRQIEASVTHILAGQPEKARDQLASIATALRTRSEALLLEHEISAALGEWKHARHLARALRRRYPGKPVMVPLLTEAIRHAGKEWQAGEILRKAGRRFPGDKNIQLHLLRHVIEWDSGD